MPLAKIVRFIVSGTTAAAVNLLSLYLLVHALGLYYLWGSVLAFLISLCASFVLQKFWTFRDRRTDALHRQFGAYALVAGGNLLLNTAIVYALVDWLGAWYLAAQFCGSIAVAVAGYFGYQHFVFHRPQATPTP